MSLLTGQYYDIPTQDDDYAHYECGAAPNKSMKRRFFLNGPGGGGWDDSGGVDSGVNARTRVTNGFRNGFLHHNFLPYTDRDGRGVHTRNGDDGEDDDDDQEMLVDD